MAFGPAQAGKVVGGLPFNKTNVYCMLVNPIYAGKIVHKTDLYDGEHEAIIAPEVFQKVQALLQHNGRTGGIQARNKHGALLRGLLFCKACGTAMVHTFVAKRNKRYRYYTCTHAIKGGWKTCPAKSLPAAEIERVVVDQVRCIGQDAEVLDEVLRQAHAQVEGELAALRAEQSDLERELGRHHREIRRPAVKVPATSATTAQIADLHDKVARAEHQAAQLREKIAGVEGERIGENDLKDAFADFDNVWQTLSPKEQAKLLALLIDRVEYDAAESTVSVAFHPSGIKALSQGQMEEEAA
jgi:site-specific DNA recombinase